MNRFPNDRGASAVEYGLIVFAIAAVIALVAFAFGLVVEETYTDTCGELAAEVQGNEAAAEC